VVQPGITQMSRNDELLSVVQRYLDSGANDDDDEEELDGMADYKFEGRPERNLFKMSEVVPAAAPQWPAGSALPLATTLAYGPEGVRRDDGFGQGGNFNALATAPQPSFAPPLAAAAAAVCLVLEVDISETVWPNAPTQLDLADVLGGGASKATACTVGQLKQYIAAHALRAQQQAWEQESQTLPRGSARVAPAPELSQAALAAALVMEPLVRDANGDDGAASGCLHDHVTLWEAPSRSSSRINQASSSSSSERDPSTGLWRGVVAVRSRAESSAEGQARRFERFANRRAFSGGGGGGSGAGFSGASGDREEVERPEETFHDALERFDHALLELNNVAATAVGSVDQESGQQAAVANFLEECLAECKTRFELVDRELPAGASAAAALASHACGATATSGSSSSSGWGDRGTGADEKVSKLAGALADEYATWQLLALLHYHKLLLRNDDDNDDGCSVEDDVSRNDGSDPTAALWLTDKEVVRQVTTLEDDDDDIARAWPQLPRRAYPCDSALLRCCVARRWLEGTFAATADFYGWSKQPFSVHQASQWTRTQRALQDSAQASSSSSLSAWAGAGAGAGAAASGVQVDALDPDAPLRGLGGGSGSGWRALASGDASEERDLCLDVWRLVRSGDLQAAVQTCASRGSAWRAALLSGGELYGSAPLGGVAGGGGAQEGSGDESSLEGAYRQLFELGLLREGAAAAALVEEFSGSSAADDWGMTASAGWASEGNSRRALWMRTCWALGRSFAEAAAATAASAPAATIGSSSSSGSGASGGIGSNSADAAVATVEGATLSALCGDVSGVLASPLVSDSPRAWENRLWALFKAMECAGLQAHLSKHHGAQRELGGSHLWPCVDSDLAADLDGDESGDWARALDATGNASSGGSAVAASPFGMSGGGAGGGNAAGNWFGSPGGGSVAFGASTSSSSSEEKSSGGRSLQANNNNDEAMHLSLVQRSLTAAAGAARNGPTGAAAPATASSAAPSTVLTPAQVFGAVGWHASSDKSGAAMGGNRNHGVNVHRQAQAAALMGARALAALLLPSSSASSSAAAPELAPPPPPAAASFTFGAPPPAAPAAASAAVGAGGAGIEAFAGALAVSETSPPYDKRFGAHLAIALRMLGFCAGNAAAEDRVDALVELYVQHLVRLGRPRLVALYCKHIHQRRRRVDNYVKLLATVKERSARELCVQLAKQWFPDDLADVTRKAVELARQQGTGEGGLQGEEKEEKGESGGSSFGFGGPSGGGSGGGGALALQANSAANAEGLALGVGSLQLVEYGGLSSGLVSASGSSSGGGGGGGGGGLSAGDLAKIKAIEWLCIDDTHKAEAVAQANELLRDFFLGPKATAALASSTSTAAASSSSSPSSSSWAWRCDAAEILLASRGLGDDDVPRAFPTQVLAALESALVAEEEGGGSGGGSNGRAAAEWARVLKEHQGWRVLLRAVQAVNEWRAAMAAASTPPQAAASSSELQVSSQQQQPSSTLQAASWGSPGLQRRGGASAMDVEERRYAAQRDGVRHAQATDAWLNDALATLLQGAMPRATQALEAVLDFQPTPRCYSVTSTSGDGGSASGGAGDGGDADADVYRMVDSLTRCEVHPAGWMLFEKDYLAPGDASSADKRTLAEAEASNASTFGASGSAFSGGASSSELGGGGGSAAAAERARRVASAQRQAADSRASMAIRRAVLPVCLMLLHEVHHATAAWLLGAAKTSAAASAYAGSSGSSSSGGGQVEGLQRLAATEFRRALQVADLAAARQHALYACLDGDALRKLLAACHTSSMELLDLTGGLEME